MNKTTGQLNTSGSIAARAVQGVVRFAFYSTISALILLSPVLADFLISGMVAA